MDGRASRAPWFRSSLRPGLLARRCSLSSTDQEDGFEFGPIPIGLATPELGYVLGSTLGAAVAGAEPCQRRIERWQQQAVTDRGVTRLVARLQQAAAGQPAAPELAAELARMYPAIA